MSTSYKERSTSYKERSTSYKLRSTSYKERSTIVCMYVYCNVCMLLDFFCGFPRALCNYAMGYFTSIFEGEEMAQMVKADKPSF